MSISCTEQYVPYELPASLWDLIQKHVHPSEQPVVKKLLGESLVEQSLELRDEVRYSNLIMNRDHNI